MILLFPHLLSSLTPYTGPWVLGTLQEAMLELRRSYSSATANSSPWNQPCRSSLPQDLIPGLLQPVHGVALQGREDGSEGGEVLQDAALLRAER